jgi:hypothetical protein
MTENVHGINEALKYVFSDIDHSLQSRYPFLDHTLEQFEITFSLVYAYHKPLQHMVMSMTVPRS